MSSYYSESFFRSFGHSLNEAQIREFSDHSNEASVDTIYDIFLSYNFKDKEIVKGVYLWLRRNGFKVYLDFEVDPQLDRRNVTKESAERIHQRLLHSSSLLYAQSPNANMSKWMPWELGVVDGNTRKCAILPITPNGAAPSPQQEYLLLYPLIKLNDNGFPRVYTKQYPFSGVALSKFIF